MSIEPLWEELRKLGQYPAHKRVSADHPLDLYAELSASGRVGLLAVSSDEPALPPKYESVDVEIGRRTDARWAVRLILANHELLPLFARLCDDIIEAGAGHDQIRKTGDFVLGRLARWRRLLDLGRDGLLGDTAIRGLVGELLFLNEAIRREGGAASVAGWNGPFDAPQDFDLPCGRFEIKAARSGSATVRVSSLEQLDVVTGSITLVVYVLQRTRLGAESVFTLPSLIGEVRAQLVTLPMVLEEFESKLLTAGYEYRDHYLSIGFGLEEVRHFSVRDDFPRLARSNLSDAFAAASYDLLLTKCEEFRVAPWGGN